MNLAGAPGYANGPGRYSAKPKDILGSPITVSSPDPGNIRKVDQKHVKRMKNHFIYLGY